MGVSRKKPGDGVIPRTEDHVRPLSPRGSVAMRVMVSMGMLMPTMIGMTAAVVRIVAMETLVRVASPVAMLPLVTFAAMRERPPIAVARIEELLTWPCQ